MSSSKPPTGDPDSPSKGDTGGFDYKTLAATLMPLMQQPIQEALAREDRSPAPSLSFRSPARGIDDDEQDELESEHNTQDEESTDAYAIVTYLRRYF